MSKHRWIEDAGELEEFCHSIVDGDVVAIDTESDHFFAYRPYVALIQVATPAEAALVDPLALPGDQLDPLLAIVEDPAVIKIMHSARNDIGELDRDWGIVPSNIFDTQLAARFLGYEKFGLNALLQETAGISLNKKYQRFDWARRPIPPPARDYAVQDVIHLFDLRDRLLRELEVEGWLPAFREQSHHIVAKSGYEEVPFDPERWRKLKGAKNLDDRGRAVCAALYAYRHELCERLDRAPLHVFENSALLEIARDRPMSRRELENVKRLSKKTLQRNADEILTVVENAMSATPPPKRPPRNLGGRKRTSEEKRREKDLLNLRQQLAEQLKLPLDFVLARAALEEIATRNPRSTADLQGIDELLSWQIELIGKQVVETCARV